MICNFRRKFLLFSLKILSNDFKNCNFIIENIFFSPEFRSEQISIENHEFSWKFIPLMSTENWKIFQKFEILKNFDWKLVFLPIFIAILYRKLQFYTEKHSKNVRKNAIFFVLNWTSCWKSGLSQDNILLIVRVRTEIWNSLF